MSDQDTTVTTEDSNETETPKPSRIKNALKKVAPYAPHITTAVVAAVGGALIFAAIQEAEDDEIEIVETEDGFAVVETPKTDDA